MLGGCTKYLQPTDVSWKKPFKLAIAAAHDSWLQKRVNEVGPDRIQPPLLFEACSWIASSWESLSIDIVKRSFVCCGITSDISGSDNSKISCLQHPDFTSVRELLEK